MSNVCELVVYSQHNHIMHKRHRRAMSLNLLELLQKEVCVPFIIGKNNAFGVNQNYS